MGALRVVHEWEVVDFSSADRMEHNHHYTVRLI